MVLKPTLSAAAVLWLAAAAFGQSPVHLPSRVQATAPMMEVSQGVTSSDSSTATAPTDAPGSACPNDSGRLWVRGDYLLWWLSGAKLPPLLTSSPAGTTVDQAGIVGAQGTVILVGNQRVNDEERSGLRFHLGTWFDDAHALGIEASFFILEGQGDGGSVGPNGIFGRPFTNAVTGLPDAQLVSFPGMVSGTAAVAAGSSEFRGFDVLLREQICESCGWRLDTLAGYRYLRFDDTVNVAETLNPQAAPFVPGTRVVTGDFFRAENTFQGMAFGLSLDCDRESWTFGMTARVDLGQVLREVSIAGATTVNVPGAAPLVNTGGLLAQATNIGTRRDADWTAVPEFEFRIGYRIRDNLTVRAGYSLLYWSKVVRAAEQIDTTVNRSLIPPTTGGVSGNLRPAFEFNDSGLCVQGASLQLEWKY